MKSEVFTFTGAEDICLPAILWLPEDAPKAVLQITHGMTEHIGRYETFARAMTQQGIAVAGFDLRGHGQNPGDAQIASFGEGGWQMSVLDMNLFYQLLEEKLPGLLHFMLGFSLGSFLLREYMAAYPSGVTGAIVMGTGYQPSAVLSLMISIVNGQCKKAGVDHTTDLVRNLSFGTYNQKFKPNRTQADWLCADTVQLDAYLADPLCRSDISSGLFRDLLASMKRTGSASVYNRWDKSVPVLLLSGRDDPVGDGGKGVKTVYEQMQKAGIQQVEMQLLAGARHDVLHEEACGAAELARQQIAAWINRML